MSLPRDYQTLQLEHVPYQVDCLFWMPADLISIFPIQAATNCDSFDPDANLWQSQNRLIDLHQHIGDSPKHLERAISIMDQVGIGLPAEVLRMFYYDNARQLLASSVPPRRVIAARL